MFKSPLKQKSSGSAPLSMKETRLRLSPLKSSGVSSSSSSHTNRGMFGHREEEDEESDTEVASSLYHEPYSLALGDSSAASGRPGKLVKNYSCGRLCDYEDSLLRRHHAPNKFGSTPLFLSSAAGGPAPSSAVATTTARSNSSKPPPTSHSFTSNIYEKDYRKPSFSGGVYANGGGGGYAVPVSRSKQSLGRALSVPPTAAPLPGSGGGENFYAATDIIQVRNILRLSCFKFMHHNF